MNNPATPATPAPEIRSDLWETMTPNELSGQLDLVIGRVNAIYSCGMASHPSYISILCALDQAQQDLTALITR